LGHRKCHDVAEKVDLLFTPKAKPSNIMEDTDIEDKGKDIDIVLTTPATITVTIMQT
jgi:hypothetical protein